MHIYYWHKLKDLIGLSQGFLGTATFLIPRLRPQYLRVRPDNPRVQNRDLRQPATRTSSTINRVLLLLRRTQSYSKTTSTAKPTTTQTVSTLWWWDPTYIPAKTESKRTLQVGRQTFQNYFHCNIRRERQTLRTIENRWVFNDDYLNVTDVCCAEKLALETNNTASTQTTGMMI